MNVSNAVGAEIPPEYQGREQSFLKHRVLEEYLTQWGHKLGSTGRGRGSSTRLWYVDAFAGPWKASHPDLRDTSIAIALDALEAAAATWASRGHVVEASAVFVEKDPKAFAKLRDHLHARKRVVRVEALHGSFGDHVPSIRNLIGDHAAFIFVDPLGWNGAAMKFIAPLVAARAPRDVLVNVMFDHMNRQKDRDVDHVRQQIRDFFGLDDRSLPSGLEEQELFALYRQQLKSKCGLRYAADLAVPHPVMDRTYFGLVIGGKSPAVLEVFRDVESKILGREAAAVREAASVRDAEKRTNQLALFVAPPVKDPMFEVQHLSDHAAAREDVARLLSQRGPLPFAAIWPEILEDRHVTVPELKKLAWDLYEERRISVRNAGPRERTMKDEHVLVSAG